MAPGQTVTFYIQRASIEAQPQHLVTLPRDVLLKHSRTAEAFLAKQPDVKASAIILKAGSPAGFRRVLSTIQAHRGNHGLEVNVRDLDTIGKLAVWHACKELGLLPVEAEHKVFRKITWDLTHEKLTPKVMQAAWDILSPHRNDPANDMYKKALVAMAHQYVWDMLHGRFTRDEQTALEATYAPIAPFGAMIGDKQDELEPKKKHHDMWMQKEEMRMINKKVREHHEKNDREKKERIDREVEEVIRGERTLTKELEPYVFARREGKYL